MHSMVLGFATGAIPQHARQRSKVHCGSDEKLQRQLSHNGVPLDTLPVDVNGNLRKSSLNVWLHKYWENASNDDVPSEEGDDDSSFISSSSSLEEVEGENSADDGANPWREGFLETDVLLGRGKMAQYHPGNLRFRDFLDQKRPAYEVLSRRQKRQACITFTRELLSNGVRFLRFRESDKTWVVSDFDDAVGKVAQFFRTRRRALLR